MIICIKYFIPIFFKVKKNGPMLQEGANLIRTKEVPIRLDGGFLNARPTEILPDEGTETQNEGMIIPPILEFEMNI